MPYISQSILHCANIIHTINFFREWVPSGANAYDFNIPFIASVINFAPTDNAFSRLKINF